jgi:hypothetical protein
MLGYTFDGIYFESMEKLLSFPKIKKLKKAYNKQEEQAFFNIFSKIKKETPQL